MVQWVWSGGVTLGQVRRVEYREGTTWLANGGGGVVLASFLEGTIMNTMKN